jgi:hypothetical protein
MEATFSFETSVDFHRTIRLYVSEERTLLLEQWFTVGTEMIV